MFIYEIPSELFEIASSFKNTDFEVESLIMIDIREFQIRVQLKLEEETAIYVRFTPGMETKVFFSDSTGSEGSEYLLWTSRDEIIEKFSEWYFDSYGFRYQDTEAENAKFQID